MTIYAMPGLVLSVWHNPNLGPINTPSSQYVTELRGGDLGASSGQGLIWWMVQTFPPDSVVTSLPAGLLIELKHNVNQRNLTVPYGDPVNPSDITVSFPGVNLQLQREIGGDRGASSGQGYCWYETTSNNFSAWDQAEMYLPKGTILCLKHSLNQPNKSGVWRGQTYDPVECARRFLPPPPTFVARAGGDLGAPSGQGYFWFEKESGPDL
jgi:hypothetical protein